MNRIAKFFLVFMLLSGPLLNLSAFASEGLPSNDSLTLAEAYVNLTLSCEFYDSIDHDRMTAILNYEEEKLSSIQNVQLTDSNPQLFDYTRALLKYLRLKRSFKPTDTISQLEASKQFLEILTPYNRSLPKRGLVQTDYYAFIGVNDASWAQQRERLLALKRAITKAINQEVYEDFKQIFYAYQNNETSPLDSLWSYMNKYKLKYNGYYKGSVWVEFVELGSAKPVSEQYDMALALDLIYTYIDLDQMASGQNTNVDTSYLHWAYDDLKHRLKPRSKRHFGRDDGIIQKDLFFAKHLSQKAIKALRKKIKKNYPMRYREDKVKDIDGVRDARDNKRQDRHYFPKKPPLATDQSSLQNFQPELRTNGQVDKYLRSLLPLGYRDHLNYYYLEDNEPGFAMMTDIEQIKSDGTPLNGDDRWDQRIVEEEGILMQAFRYMFLKTKRECRILVFVVSKNEVINSRERAQVGAITELLNESHSSLPSELAAMALDHKVLTTMVYHFKLNDVGEVPELNRNKIPTVTSHLSKSGISIPE